MNKIDYLEKELSRLLEWIKSADTRISLILPLSTAMLGTIAALLPKFSLWTWCIGLSVTLSILLLAASLISVSVALFPRTNGPNNSNVFFGGINTKGLEQYRNEINQLNEEQYKTDLINQCFINARIANIKFYWVKKSLMFLLLSSLPWLFTIYVLFGLK
jgi:hypothetical protein